MEESFFVQRVNNNNKKTQDNSPTGKITVIKAMDCASEMERCIRRQLHAVVEHLIVLCFSS